MHVMGPPKVASRERCVAEPPEPSFCPKDRPQPLFSWGILSQVILARNAPSRKAGLWGL